MYCIFGLKVHKKALTVSLSWRTDERADGIFMKTVSQ